MASESSTVPRRTGIVNSPSLQLLPSGQDVSGILQQTCGEISQTTTAEMVEVANSAVFWSKLQDLLPVYFYSWQLQSLEAVIIHLLLHYFILLRDGSERREGRPAFQEYIERLKSRVAELEKKLYTRVEPRSTNWRRSWRKGENQIQRWRGSRSKFKSWNGRTRNCCVHTMRLVCPSVCLYIVLQYIL